MKNILLFTSAFLLLSVGVVSYAQEPQSPPAQPQDQKSEGTPATLKGCLTKGSEAQMYSVADEASGQKVMFSGSAKLDNYVNQTVELTGAIVERGGEKAFQPRTIKTVAASCKSGQN
ncbi:hypothetical protein [uncultured Paludibaculum sp.]|uniref:hypothetical protein n=1 Tax=uncultured Paludibaculum sp. TaxID=1765020 RepID=UPI002AAA9E80|nr:hypothetical protein [uncultured Paludibaculum sp.]